MNDPNTLVEYQKVQLEVLQRREERLWEQFNQRRNHEYKVSLSIWTGLALALAAALSGKVSTALGSAWPLRIVAALLPAAICALHCVWARGVQAAGRIDRGAAIDLERIIQARCGATYPPDGEFRRAKAEQRASRAMLRRQFGWLPFVGGVSGHKGKKSPSRSPFGEFSLYVEVGITVVLAVALAMVILFAPSPPPKEAAPAAVQVFAFESAGDEVVNTHHNGRDCPEDTRQPD